MKKIPSLKDKILFKINLIIYELFSKPAINPYWEMSKSFSQIRRELMQEYGELIPGEVYPYPEGNHYSPYPISNNDDLSKAKNILKQAIKDASLPVKICAIQDLHPTTYREVEGHIHQIQNILIAEYVRYTDLKDEIGLQ